METDSTFSCLKMLIPRTAYVKNVIRKFFVKPAPKMRWGRLSVFTESEENFWGIWIGAEYKAHLTK